MQKLRLTFAALGVAAIGATVPITAAQAATAEGSSAKASSAQVETTDARKANHCDNVYRKYKGQMRAYYRTKCHGFLGWDKNNDRNWGVDGNRATSLVNSHKSATVKFYTKKNYKGGHGCLSSKENWVTDLRDNKMSDGAPANNTISSHKLSSSCSQWLY